MILINGNWEIVRNLQDVSKIVREYYNDELADELDNLIPDDEYIDENEIDTLKYEIGELEYEVSVLEEEISELNYKVTELELVNIILKEHIKKICYEVKDYE